MSSDASARLPGRTVGALEEAGSYIDRTESAVRHLIEGMEGYRRIITEAPSAVFVGSYGSEVDRQSAFESWAVNNEAEIQQSLEAQRRYIYETFAENALSGALLEIMAIGIRKFSPVRQVQTSLPSDIGIRKKHVPYCIGRHVRGLPIGLLVLAGRNHFAHIDDEHLNEPAKSIFRALARNHGIRGANGVLDPAFNLEARRELCLAGNVVALIGWRSYADYLTDARILYGL
jgi:hypothetical protein